LNLFNATNRPDDTGHMLPITVIDRGIFIEPDGQGIDWPSLDETKLAAIAKTAGKTPGARLVFDYERRFFQRSATAKNLFDAVIASTLDMVAAAKAAAPGIQVSFWGLPQGLDVEPNYTSSAKVTKSDNDALATTLFPKLDFLCPAPYPYVRVAPDKSLTMDLKAWSDQAWWEVAESQRVGAGKPIIPFLMFRVSADGKTFVPLQDVQAYRMLATTARMPIAGTAIFDSPAYDTPVIPTMSGLPWFKTLNWAAQWDPIYPGELFPNG
jgi:hypothetical protein